MLKEIKTFVQWLLSIKPIRKSVNALNYYILWLASRNRITSLIYYLLFFFTFSREQYAVLRGRLAYYRSLERAGGGEKPYLRRNIHRLEKGILMQPRRKIFALDYIDETIDYYDNAIDEFTHEPSMIDIEELLWARDVLTEYFRVVEKTPHITNLEVKFNKLTNLLPNRDEVLRIPYARGVAQKSPVEYEDLLALSMKRRSVRWYLDKPVPRKLIDKALLIARQSPTACNRMPYEFRIYDEPNLVKKVADIPFGAGGYAHNIPTIVVLVGKLDLYFSPRDRHVIYIDTSLAAMGFMYALETLGLSSSVINWPDFEPLEYKMQKAIGLSVEERPIMLIAVGYADPAGLVAYSQKKSMDKIRSYNKSGNKSI
jgi:nitroreductase